MNLPGQLARFSTQRETHPAWRLLAANNAPLILATLGDLFREQLEVPLARAKVALDVELGRLRESGAGYQESATSYLREWIASGWLREQDSLLSLTDAAELALSFARGLDQRVEGTSASHLRIVQDAVRDLAVALSPDADVRIEALTAQRDALNGQIQRLKGGEMEHLSQAEQRERLREIYHLASTLSGDFRRLEDEIRHMDRQLRVDMIQDDSSRGAVLEKLLNEEDALSRTEAGRAFAGFFSLLSDDLRTTEFREQLRAILDLAIEDAVTPSQRHFLAHLVRELSRESERVLNVRRRTEESLRAYVESNEFRENRAVSRLLTQLEQLAIELRDRGVSPRTICDMGLDSGRAEVHSVSSLRLRLPEEALEVGELAVRESLLGPGEDVLDHLETIKVLDIASEIRELLINRGGMSLGQLIEQRPVVGGLEELVACIRVAQAVQAPRDEARERVVVQTREGDFLKADIPSYLLTADMFPAHLEELAL